MRLEQLQAFLQIVQTGSFQQAAIRCGVNQSTVSRQIQAMEADLGLELFHRNSQAKLTLAGERLLPHIRNICQEWQIAAQDIKDLVSGNQAALSIAAIHSFSAYYLPAVLRQFSHDYPKVHPQVTSLGSDRAISYLNDGSVDIAIVMSHPQLHFGKEIVAEVLYHEPIEVLVSANHPLATHQLIPWCELIRYPQVIFRDGYGMKRLVKDKFEFSNTKLQAVLEVSSLDAFRGVVRQGELVALLPHSAMFEAIHDPTLAIRPLVCNSNVSTSENFHFTRTVAIATTGDRLKIPSIKSFWDLILENVPPKFSSENLIAS
ncbi:MAG: LysR family transcriptional regulator [Cyanobacteria bacterium P01_A01_bin.45]|mgnify:CR=1 FL=1